jgi:putative transposase
MAIHRKVYRFRMRPTPAQGDALNRVAAARRFVWNWGLARWKELYKATGKSTTYNRLAAELTALKRQPGFEWLNQVDSQALQQALKDLHRAFANFFAKRARYPRFKSRKRDPARFRIPQRIKIEDDKVYVPKVGWVRIRRSREVDDTIKGATFREADGH